VHARSVAISICQPPMPGTARSPTTETMSISLEKACQTVLSPACMFS
jgi:hypothetical protein